jgi:nucleotide-binding universal stress UspA family protein
MADVVLLPVDLNSEDSEKKPLAEALKLLSKGGELHVVTVLPDFGMSQVSGFFRQGYESEAIRKCGTALAQWVNDNVPDEVETHPHVLHGTIYDEILRAANRLNADVIVMGAHRPELRDYLLGPNAARVVRHAAQSVYVVRS